MFRLFEQFPFESPCFPRLLQQRFKQTIISARYGGVTEATKRLLAQLPICAQSYSSSPYLDLSLFCYDDKWVSMMERPKACGEHPIRLATYVYFSDKKLFEKINFREYYLSVFLFLQLLCTRFGSLKIQDVCRHVGTDSTDGCKTTSRVHVPSDGPVRNFGATHERGIHRQFSR